MIQKIGNKDGQYDDYVMACILCDSTKGLSFVAHRRDKFINGWIVACQECCPKLYNLKVLTNVEKFYNDNL